jgi:hypothetical protein
MMIWALVVLSITNIFFFYRSYSFAKLNIQLRDLLEQLSDLPSKDEKEEMNESFLKFVSDSRDWAFKYIEDVQNGLNKFVSEVEPHINHFDNYGEALWTPLSPVMKDISKSFKDLKTLLPEEPNN